METRMNQRLFIIVLLSLSVGLTGCSRQLYTALVSSEDESGRTSSRLVASPSTSEGFSSQHISSTSDGSLQGAESASDLLVEGPPLPYLRDSSSPSSFLPGMGNIGGRPSQGEFGAGAHPGEVIESVLSSSSASDEITPLDGTNMLTEMAAASATSDPTGLDGDAFSSRRNGAELIPLGNELSSKGNLGDIFFDFDKVAIRSDAESILEVNARILKSRIEDRRVVIEGHCDERGTAEYNLVLGDRRAQSTKQYLVDLGVSASTIQIVSYGKEKPFCTASKPDCWKMNRRGHFVVR